MHQQLKEQLTDFLAGRLCLLGIGNRLWRDDGVGSLFIAALASNRGFDAIDAGIVPENYLETVVSKNPDRILLVDATDFGGPPGGARLLYPDRISFSGLSTHAGSLRMICEYLQSRTPAPIALLAIQPADSSAGEDLSPPVSHTIDTLLGFFEEVFSNHPRV
jgi:hydrogenase maturation protease